MNNKGKERIENQQQTSDGHKNNKVMDTDDLKEIYESANIAKAIEDFDIANIDLNRLRLSEEDMNAIRKKLSNVLSSLREGKTIQLTEEDKNMIEKIAKQALADVLDIDLEKITRESHLMNDLGMDSLAYLEMFDEFQEVIKLDLDVNILAKYAQDYPVETFGEYLDQLYIFIEKYEQIFKELNIDVDNIMQKHWNLDLENQNAE